MKYRELEKLLAEQLEALKFLKSDARLEKELELEAKLLDLLAEYSLSMRDIVQILDPRAQQPVSG
jgi:hypothetical protein